MPLIPNRVVTALGLSSLLVAGVVTAQGPAGAPAESVPIWAYSPPNPADAAFATTDLDTPLHMPGSELSFTRRQVIDNFAPVDWHPADHPLPPPPVLHGKPPNARACALCHLTTGAGHPASGYLAGQPKEYLLEQIAEFRNGNRKSSVPARSAPMILAATEWGDDEVKAAVEYFSALPRRWSARLVESATVPETVQPGQMRFVRPGGAMEPLGQRIIEFAEVRERGENDDTRAGFLAYVPPGSVERGENLVTTGGTTVVPGRIVPGRTVPCATCHGPDLRGLGTVPGLVGLHPIYIVRQLYDIQHGTRTGAAVALMQPVVVSLTIEDMISIAAYTTSRDPGGRDQRPPLVRLSQTLGTR